MKTSLSLFCITFIDKLTHQVTGLSLRPQNKTIGMIRDKPEQTTNKTHSQNPVKSTPHSTLDIYKRGIHSTPQAVMNLQLMSHSLEVEVARWSWLPVVMHLCSCERHIVQNEEHILCNALCLMCAERDITLQFSSISWKYTNFVIMCWNYTCERLF